MSSSLSPARRRGGIEREADQEPFRAADPVLLHQPDLLGPALEPVERVEEVLRVIGDLQEPLGQLALLDGRAGAPAAAVDDLLVGEDGLVDRIPVHARRAAVDEAGFEEIQEQTLLVLVIGRIASGDLAAPVERQPHRLQLSAHGVDIGVGPRAGMHAAIAGGVLGRQAEGVPAHRVEDVEPLRPHEARHHVAHGVVAHVPHMDAARRIGEHLEDVIFRARVVVAGPEDLPVGPGLLPFRLGFLGVVTLRDHEALFG